ncbi:MAG: GntR family transcriptional regulator [Streptosporangiaceae bacterium]|nr:GntR family transcriptional regulator [Streptosporangiaceae bacterium]
MPLITINPASRQPAWQQAADAIREAIRSGMLVPGEQLPSVREMSALQEIPAATLQHALAVLAEDRLVVIRQGRTAVVAGDADPAGRPGRVQRKRDHDCSRAGVHAACLQAVDGQHDPEYSQHRVRRLRRGETVGGIAWNPAESPNLRPLRGGRCLPPRPRTSRRWSPRAVRHTRRWRCTSGWWRSLARGGASYAHCRSVTSTWTRGFSTSRSTMSWSTATGSARTPRPIRSGTSPSTRQPAR